MIVVTMRNDSMIYQDLHEHFRRSKMAKEAALPGRAHLGT
jgi:hypothetical protein